MTPPTNLAQLKRYLTPGMLLFRTHTKFCPEGETVPVVRAQTVAFSHRIQSGPSAGKESWHTYQPAKCYAFDREGFTVELNHGYGTARYAYVNQEPAP